ncbi:MAG: cation diffusion facilitator family transporter [Acuticoccus sp.]
MGHDHSHEKDAGDGRLLLAIVVNLGLTVLQVVAGILAGSLALIADALHNLSDAASLVIAMVARRIARRPPDKGMSFGYGRAEPIAALINYTTLVVLALSLAAEAVDRLFNPEPVEGWIVVIVAGVALVIDAVTALLTYAMSKNSMNIRAAFIHNLADAIGSVAVIIAGTLILVFGWQIADPLITLGISAYILWLAFQEMGGVLRMLMLASPPGSDPSAVVAAINDVTGVANVHHAHLWQMQEHAAAFDAHVTIDPGRWGEADAIKAAIKAMLTEKFAISHTTLELECAAHACPDPIVFGHGQEDGERHSHG